MTLRGPPLPRVCTAGRTTRASAKRSRMVSAPPVRMDGAAATLRGSPLPRVCTAGRTTRSCSSLSSVNRDRQRGMRDRPEGRRLGSSDLFRASVGLYGGFLTVARLCMPSRPAGGRQCCIVVRSRVAPRRSSGPRFSRCRPRAGRGSEMRCTASLMATWSSRRYWEKTRVGHRSSSPRPGKDSPPEPPSPPRHPRPGQQRQQPAPLVPSRSSRVRRSRITSHNSAITRSRMSSQRGR